MEVIAISAHKRFVIMFLVVIQPTSDRFRGRVILVLFCGVNAVDTEIAARNFVRRALNHSGPPPPRIRTYLSGTVVSCTCDTRYKAHSKDLMLLPNTYKPSTEQSV